MSLHSFGIFLLSIIFFGCSESAENIDLVENNSANSLKQEKQILDINEGLEEADFDSVTYRKLALEFSYEQGNYYDLKDSIFADFNGDGFEDMAIFIQNDSLSGIVIVHGNNGNKVRIGFDESFDLLTNLDWVDYWGLVRDKETFQSVIDENGDIGAGEKIALENPSIAIGADELGGGLITFKNGEYIWIHQTC